jgi:uncharacterized membrane protein
MSSLPRRFATAYAVAALIFLLLDALWLTTMASRLYRPAIGHLMRPDFDLMAAALFYALYLLGIVVFVVRSAGSIGQAFARGALFGLICYATYDLTNQATLVGWPWRVTLVDLLWGAFVTGTSAAAARRLPGPAPR